MSDALDAAIVIMAKPPTVAKSRLRKECGSEVADSMAVAMLRDTLDAVGGSSAGTRVVAMLGEAGPWIPAGFETINQRGRDLAERLASVFDDTGKPTIAIAMDTPQVTSELLDEAIAALLYSDTDAVLGPATDGGYWAIGLRHADPRVFLDVPMSTGTTAIVQRRRLRELDLSTRLLPELRDIDSFRDAIAVAATAPHSRLAAAMTRLNVEVS